METYIVETGASSESFRSRNVSKINIFLIFSTFRSLKVTV